MDEASTPDALNSQIKRNKGVVTSLWVRWLPRVLAARVSSAHTDSLAVRPRRRWLALCALLTRDPQRVRAHVHKAPSSPLWPSATRALFKHKPFTLFNTSDSRHVRSRPRLALSLRSPPPGLSLLALRPLSGVRNPSPPIGGGHASFSRHRDRWAFTPGETTTVGFSCCRLP